MIVRQDHLSELKPPQTESPEGRWQCGHPPPPANDAGDVHWEDVRDWLDRLDIYTRVSRGQETLECRACPEQPILGLNHPNRFNINTAGHIPYQQVQDLLAILRMSGRA
ncbi:MAG: hypothetical protein ACTS3F_05775 [Phycisphaerales bacterium]